jgi:hypothetical protein
MRKAGNRLSVVFAMMLIAGSAAWAAGGVKASFDPGRVQWDAQGEYERAVLTVSLPGGEVMRQELDAKETLAFELPVGARDGAYTYELWLVPRIDASLCKALAEARRSGDAAAIVRLREELPESPVVSGGFLVEAGAIVVPKPAAGSPRNVTAADQVILDDLIVKGNECIGTDCVNNETFGSDTLRIKTLTPRIKLDDTSSSPGFPFNDWQITANDPDTGGANKFSIDDITGAKVPFTLTAGAPTNSIFVAGSGRVGFRTATPALDLHISTGDTPAIRLEQNASGGMTAQTWDLVADEVNFFVRDVTGGDRQPFRIRPGAPTSSLDISSSGRVGLGTASPSAQLHVLSTGSAFALIQDNSGTAATRTLLQLQNNGASRLTFTDDSAAASWNLQNTSGNFNMLKSGVGVTAFVLQGSGALTIAGSLTQGSDRNSKTGIVEVDPDTILARVADLPISEWTYKADDSRARHLGPMAQDFAAAFRLGQDDLHIAPGDMAGVSLAAIQALHRQLSELAAQNRQLAERLAALEAELAAVKAVPSDIP